MRKKPDCRGRSDPDNAASLTDSNSQNGWGLAMPALSHGIFATFYSFFGLKVWIGMEKSRRGHGLEHKIKRFGRSVLADRHVAWVRGINIRLLLALSCNPAD
jgi:hypothetical protein